MKAITKQYGKSKWIHTRHGDKYLRDCALINMLYKLGQINKGEYQQTIKELDSYYGMSNA